MPEVQVLDEATTSTLLAGTPARASALITEIAQNIMTVVDTGQGVWATGLNESAINSLRTRMYRKDVVITVRTVTRDGTKGSVITGRRIQPGERG